MKKPVIRVTRLKHREVSSLDEVECDENIYCSAAGYVCENRSTTILSSSQKVCNDSFHLSSLSALYV